MLGQGDSVHAECAFSSAPISGLCYVNMIGVTSMNKTFVKNSPNDLTVQGCIESLPAGNYTFYVYDVENILESKLTVP